MGRNTAVSYANGFIEIIIVAGARQSGGVGGRCPVARLVRILELEERAGRAAYWAGVVFEPVTQVLGVHRVGDSGGIWIGYERVEWERIYGVAGCGVEIHVLGEAVGVEEIVARPSGLGRREGCPVELH